jgi:hypothetical protein
MDAGTTAKSGRINRLEGTALTALEILPTMTGGALLLRLGSHFGGSHLYNYEAVNMVVGGSLGYALLMPWLARNFPSPFQATYQPLFFDASLSFSDKVTRSLTQPSTSWRLLTNALMLSVLAVAVLSVA